MCCCLRSVKQFQDEHTWPHCIKVKYVSGIFVAIICLSLHRDQGYCKYNYIFRTSFMFSFLCCIWFHQINSLIKILFLFLQSKNLIGTLTALCTCLTVTVLTTANMQIQICYILIISLNICNYMTNMISLELIFYPVPA